MKTINKSVFEFLQELAKNNNKEWFDKNRSRYKKVREEVQEFVDELIYMMATFDKKLIDDEVKGYIFRINRDSRFSKNKSPYKTNIGILILSGGRNSMMEKAGYYLHIEPGKSIIGGGAYKPQSSWLNQIRDKILENPDEIKKIIYNKSFNKYFQLENDMLKTAPRGYAKDHPEIELLRYKSFAGLCELTNKQVLNPNFMEYCALAFKELHPLNEFLNKKNKI